MSTPPPVWGTPDSAGPPRPATGGVQDVPPFAPPPPPPPPPGGVQWTHTPAGLSRPQLDPDAIGRQAAVALVVNLLVLFLAVGLCSAPGAAMALRARSLAYVDPVRAQRSLKWSWLLLASNLLLYLLLAVVALMLFLSLVTSHIHF